MDGFAEVLAGVGDALVGAAVEGGTADVVTTALGVGAAVGCWSDAYLIPVAPATSVTTAATATTAFVAAGSVAQCVTP